MAERVIAIGDIHGCSQALEAVLRAIGPQADDTVVALGDYIDRGPDSRGVVERMLKLAKECRLVPLLGQAVAGDAEAYRYLPASAYRFLQARELAGAMRQAGLRAVRYRWLGLGTVALHVGEVGWPSP